MLSGLPHRLPPHGEIRLAVETSGCFHHRAHTLLVTWSEQSTSVLLDDEPREMARDQVLALATRILATAAHPEVSQDGRSTTSYQAKLRLRERPTADAPWTSSEAIFLSRDLPRSAIEQVLTQRPALASRVPAGSYARAIELHELVVSLASSRAP